MEATLRVLNDLEQAGVIRHYAIGRAMAATFYAEPLLTFDLDVFVELPQTRGGLLTLEPLYEAVRVRGYREEDECVNIEGVPVRFLPVYNGLLEEAVADARHTLSRPRPLTCCGRSILLPSPCRPAARRTVSECACYMSRQASIQTIWLECSLATDWKHGGTNGTHES
jgi:hypothetical protein